MEHKKEGKRVFGDSLIGTWFCNKCSYTILPGKLKDGENLFVWSNKSESVLSGYVGPHCKECGAPMEYDEAA